MTSYLLAAVIISFCLGAAVGMWREGEEWRRNAGEPRRVSRRGTYYKVVQLNDPWSWSMFSIHEDERPKQ